MSKTYGIKQRNLTAIAAHFRKAGAMKHRCTPRGGASNWRDLTADEVCSYCGEQHEEPCCLAAEEAEQGHLTEPDYFEYDD